MKSGETSNPNAPTRPPKIWVLADERRGTANQALGVADALGLDYEIKDITHSSLARLPNFLLGASRLGLSRELRPTIRPPWPDLVISAGRRTAPIARHIKRKNGARTILAHMMYPGSWGVKDFNIIAVPRHDGLNDPILFQTIGAPHRITPTGLAEASEKWRDPFKKFAKPWLGLILGGSTRHRRITTDMGRELGRQVGRMAADMGGSLLITTSPRTRDLINSVADGAEAEGAPPAYIYHWDADGENPYHGFLALADVLVVSGDSVSMCTEACAVSKPVYIYSPPGFAVDKHQRLHEELYEAGYARPLDDETLAGGFEDWNHPSLNPAEVIADEIRKRMEG